MDEGKKKRIDEILAKVQTLPPLPAAVEQLCRMSDDPNVTVPEMVKVLSMDATLTARLLRVANSTFYGFSGKIGTISRAVMVLGGQQIRNIALGISIFGVRNRASAHRPLKYEAFWRHFVAVAVGARMVAKRFRLGDPEEAFVGGLLHDMGKTVYMEFLPQDYDVVLEVKEMNQRPLCELEKDAFEMDHAEVGEKLCQYWKIPRGLTQLVADHHVVPVGESGTQGWRRVTTAIKIANCLAKIADLGDAGEMLIDPDLPSLLKTAPSGFRICQEILVDFPAEVEQAESLFEIPGGSRVADPEVDPTGNPVLVLLEGEYEQQVVALTLNALGRSVLFNRKNLDVSKLGGIVVDDALAADLDEELKGSGAPILDLSAWRAQNTRDGSGPFHATRLRAWLNRSIAEC